MQNRREWLQRTTVALAALGLSPRHAQALAKTLAQGSIIRKAIPSSGETIPVIGLGSSATFASVARGDEVTALKEVFRVMAERGATVFDTAPGYGASEEVAAGIVNELGFADRFFWATKLNAAPRGAGGPGSAGGAKAEPAAIKAQLDRSFALLKRPKIDLIQVHNMSDVPTQLAALQQLKKEGRVRYVGVTTTFEPQYAGLIEVMRNEPLDFIGIDYAADNRRVEETILPLAQQRKIAVLAYAPFGRTSLFRRIGDRPLPEWAAECDATSWPQLLLKFVVSHPAVTATTPATSQARHMIDNIGGGIGRLPDAALRKRISDFVDALPAPPPRGRPGT